MKKAILASLIASAVLLSGCSSALNSALEEAQAFYAAGNYQNVIWCLEEYRGNEEVDAMIFSAEVQLALVRAKEAMNEGDYEKAVSILSSYSELPEVAAAYAEAEKAAKEKRSEESKNRRDIKIRAL